MKNTELITYESLAHEQRELSLWIDNTEDLYLLMKHYIGKGKMIYIKNVVENAACDYHFEDTVFSKTDINQVAKYYYSEYVETDQEY